MAAGCWRALARYWRHQHSSFFWVGLEIWRVAFPGECYASLQFRDVFVPTSLPALHKCVERVVETNKRGVVERMSRHVVRRGFGVALGSSYTCRPTVRNSHLRRLSYIEHFQRFSP